MKHSFSIRNAMYWIFCIFGLDFDCLRNKNKGNMRLCHSLRYTLFISIAFLHIVSAVRVEDSTTKLDFLKNVKFFFSALIVTCCSILLLYILRISQHKIAKILQSVSQIRNSVCVKNSNNFSSICIIFTIISYLVHVLLRLHPFTDERYTILLSRFSLGSLYNKNLKCFLAFALIACIEAFNYLLPSIFMTMYIITCHDIKIILKYFRHTNITLFHSKNRFRLLDDYLLVLSKFKIFNSEFSIPICLSFTSKITVIFVIALLIHGNEEQRCHNATVTLITLTTFLLLLQI